MHRHASGRAAALMHRHLSGKSAALWLLAVLAVLPGCGSIGPGRMLHDRTDYNAAFTESWKRQLLLNVVKLRYAEPIFFMEVGDIVAGYTIETGGNAGFSRSFYDAPTQITTNNNPVIGNFGRLELGVSARYTDRPTITYKPMTGTPFRRGVMSALPARNIMASLDTGVSAHFLFNLGVKSMNGLRNGVFTASGNVAAQEGFKRAVEILAQLQLAGALRVRAEPGQGGADGRLFLLAGGKKPAPEVAALVSELRTLLELDPQVYEYELIVDPEVTNRRQIALQTFSLMQIMAAVAARVDIPVEDIAANRAAPAPPDAPGTGVLGPVAVKSGKAKPLESFAAIPFHGHWFWVDDHDLGAKRVFSFLMLAFILMEDKGVTLPPQLTIPVQ